MPQDAITLSYLAKELNNVLKKGKILKITQPESDEIHLQIYSNAGQKKVVLSSNSNSPRCHITNITKQNPQSPPSFCMLLRKHLSNGIINRVTTVEGDRVIIFEVQAKNEMQDNVSISLIVELMSRQSNILLVDQKGIILGLIKSYSFDSMTRKLMTGLKYEVPTQDKFAPTNYDKIREVLENYKEGELAKYILEHVCGLAYSTVSEILLKSIGAIDCNELTDHMKDSIINGFKCMNNLMDNGDFAPCVSYSKGVPKEYYAVPYAHTALDFVQKESINDAVESYYLEKDAKQRIGEHSKSLSTVLKNTISRNEKKLTAQLNQLEDSKDCETDKIKGELITSNIYKINQGDSEIIVDNYYVEDCPKITIALNKALSPSKNAQNFYKRYSKKKRTIANVEVQIQETRSTLEMLKIIDANLKSITTTEEVALIREDLVNAGIVRKEPMKKGKKEKVKPAAPLEYSFDGFRIFVGRNSTENEFVTHKIGRNKDMWFHAKSNFGAHVILKFENREFTDEAIVLCGEIAGYYAASGTGEKIEVDYTEVKNVSKPPSNKLGLVIYHTNWSMLVDPKQHSELLVKYKNK